MASLQTLPIGGEEQPNATDPRRFARHAGYQRLFAGPRMTFGFTTPLQGYADSAVPDMTPHLALARLADDVGIQALWLRDVPLLDPSFGDAGQVFDTFTYLGYLAAVTSRIVLGTAAVVLPLRSPIHVAKAAASVDVLSGGRLVLGVASGDRPVEYPAFDADFPSRGKRVRESLRIMRPLWRETFPDIDIGGKRMSGTDLLPKPTCGDIPVIVSGYAQQELAWIAVHADGWFQHPHPRPRLAGMLEDWKRHSPPGAAEGGKPFMGSLLLDLDEDPDHPPHRFRLGYRVGRKGLLEILHEHERMGMRHLLINWRFSRRPGEEIIREFAEEILPQFI